MNLQEIIESDELLEVGRKAVEDCLVDFRDSGLSMLNRNNGLVIKSKKGDSSHIIRMGPEDAIRVGLKAIKEHLEEKNVQIKN
jgi:hypothetical protein